MAKLRAIAPQMEPAIAGYAVLLIALTDGVTAWAACNVYRFLCGLLYCEVVPLNIVRMV